MLKQRLISSIVVRDGIAVQSIGFNRYLPVGDPAISAENFDRWGVDEILLQDISATPDGRLVSLDLIERVARNCFVPLAVAGGIKSVDDVRSVIRAGADKVVVGDAAINDPDLVGRIAASFGAQCVVVCLDIERDAEQIPCLYRRNAAANEDLLPPFELAESLVENGAGEVLVNTVHRDGTKSGYDLGLISEMASAIEVPLIASGGAGHPEHFKEVLDIPGVSAAAAGNYFHFTEHSILTTKAYLRRNGIKLRADTAADYYAHSTDDIGRLKKLPDAQLLDLVFERIEEEVI
jgi:cyclase